VLFANLINKKLITNKGESVCNQLGLFGEEDLFGGEVNARNEKII
jgi:hypothetical protein